ncbi:hypothetical protein ABEV54_02155 [Peribacillus psychrosaccharolyticus]|uniref:hypothetical protein n=1 Tax=Peribacillus psychrosaccharolyticus TaxID=1407 RepID=UPI003D29A690
MTVREESLRVEAQLIGVREESTSRESRYCSWSGCSNEKKPSRLAVEDFLIFLSHQVCDKIEKDEGS